MKTLISLCAQSQDSRQRLAVVDVKRAYFDAPAIREIYIEIPAEDREPGDEHRVGELQYSMCGTRHAAQN